MGLKLDMVYGTLFSVHIVQFTPKILHGAIIICSNSHSIQGKIMSTTGSSIMTISHLKLVIKLSIEVVVSLFIIFFFLFPDHSCTSFRCLPTDKIMER